MSMRPIWYGVLGGLLVSPLGVAVALACRYMWPGFPLLRVLDVLAGFVATPLAVLTGRPVLLDASGGVEGGLLTLLLAYGVVMVAWCLVGGLAVGGLLEQIRAPSSKGGEA